MIQGLGDPLVLLVLRAPLLPQAKASLDLGALMDQQGPQDCQGFLGGMVSRE